jgi:hypothetical protein
LLYQYESGFIDVVYEPQFAKYQFGSKLCSVRASDVNSLLAMKNSIRGEIDYRPNDQEFPFTGFAYADDLCRELKTKSLLEKIDVLEDFTHPPKAFFFLGFEYADPYTYDAETWQGNLLPQEVFDFQYGAPANFEYFRVWPLFNVPSELSSWRSR